MKVMLQSSVVRRTALVLLAALLLGGIVVGQAALPAQAQTTNLALNRPVTCSSTENASLPCANAVDGNTGTRWSSAFSDPQWIYVDLGVTTSISRVVLNWEAAYGRSYQIQVSGSSSGPWTSIYSTTTGNGGADDLAVSGSGRYVRMYGTTRATPYGYSLWEFQVYGTTVTPTPTTPPPPGTPYPLSVSPLPEHTCEQEINIQGITPQYSNVSVWVYNLNSGQSQRYGAWVQNYSFSIPVALYGETQNGIVVQSCGDVVPVSCTTVSYEQHPELIVNTTGCVTPTNTPTPTATATPTPPPPANLALNRPATASSTENSGLPATNAVDGRTGTRWSSRFSDPQWIQVDLGATYAINRVVLRWEAAYGRAYQIQISDDAGTWTTIYTTDTGNGGVDDLSGLSGSGRYVRMYGTRRATQWGYSLWEFEVYGGPAGG